MSYGKMVSMNDTDIFKAWDHTIEAGHIWHAEDMDFEEQQHAFVTLLKSDPWIQEQIALEEEGDLTFADLLVDIIDELALALDEEDFDNAMYSLYNWADEGKRLFIDTF